MAAKIKCPDCGAKNPETNHRCRLCTAVINPNAAAPVEEAPPTPLGVDHFDAGEINRQVRPARERFGSSTSGLSDRLAAARGTTTELVPDQGANDPGPTSEATFGDPAFDNTTFGESAFDAPSPQAGAVPTSTAAPIEYEDEPFDPDALFRDMG